MRATRHVTIYFVVRGRKKEAFTVERKVLWPVCGLLGLIERKQNWGSFKFAGCYERDWKSKSKYKCMIHLSIDTTPIETCFFFYSAESIKREWRGCCVVFFFAFFPQVLSSPNMPFFHIVRGYSRCNPLVVAPGGQIKGAGAGSANLRHADSDYTERKTQGYFQAWEIQRWNDTKDNGCQIFFLIRYWNISDFSKCQRGT